MAEVEADPRLPDNREFRNMEREEQDGNAKSEDHKVLGSQYTPSDSKNEKFNKGVKDEEKKSSKLKELWGKLRLDLGTLLMMLK